MIGASAGLLPIVTDPGAGGPALSRTGTTRISARPESNARTPHCHSVHTGGASPHHRPSMANGRNGTLPYFIMRSYPLVLAFSCFGVFLLQ